MEKVIYLLNAVLLFFIARFEYNSNSDKTIIISSIALMVLVGINVILGLFAQFDKNPIYKHFYFSALWLVIGAMILVWIY